MIRKIFLEGNPLTAHATGGLSENDFIMANLIDGLK